MNVSERLERTNLDMFWAPLDARIIDRPELVVLGCDRPVPHVNICHWLRADASEVDALVDEAIAHMSPDCSRFFVTDNMERAPLENALRERGYVDAIMADARVASPDLEVGDPGVEVRKVDSLEGIALHIRLMTRAFKTDEDPDIVEPERKLAQCTGEAPRTIRYIAYVDDEPVATSGLNWFPELEIALLWGGSTLPHARGRGCYRSMVARRLRDAKKMGARFVGLYAVSKTSGPIVDALGFEKVGQAWFWRPDGSPGPVLD